MVNVAKSVAILNILLAASQGLAAQDKAQVQRGIKVYTDQKCST